MSSPIQARRDEELMLDLKRGNLEAFTILYERYQRRLYNFILRYVEDPSTAEDLFQETFLKVYRLREAYDQKALFVTWLYTIARNLCWDERKSPRRRQGERSQPPRLPSSEPADPSPGPLGTLEAKEREALVRKAIASLPDVDREVLILSRYEGLRYEEIAKVLGTSAQAVKARAHRALTALKEHLKQYGGLA